MTQGATIPCPKGHASTEADYCSECGAKINGGESAGQEVPTGSPSDSNAGLCPDCGTPRDQGGTIYCEVCGYNFATGAHGEVPLPAPAEAQPSQTLDGVTADAAEAKSRTPNIPEVAPESWSVTATVDPALRAAGSPAAPADVAPFSVELVQPVSLIGRRNESRAIFPEIALDHDDAVSRRHALLQIGPQKQLHLRDIGAANGTRLNGLELQPMTDYALKDGDEITLGHWSRLRILAS